MTAIVSTAPAIDADEREVAYAVANVVAFGLFGMLTYPYLAHALLQRSETVGLFLGTAIHDTSQVVGAALTYRQMYADDVVLRVATVTKLTRNLFLAARHSAADVDARALDARRRIGTSALADWKTLVPTFVVGFVAMAVVRTRRRRHAAVDRARRTASGMPRRGRALTNQIGDFWASRLFLGTAMAAVGLNTSFAVFKGVGAKPFVVGFAGALVVGAVGMLMALLLGPYVAL